MNCNDFNCSQEHLGSLERTLLDNKTVKYEEIREAKMKLLEEYNCLLTEHDETMYCLHYQTQLVLTISYYDIQRNRYI